jgi:hypothetical protein
VRADITEQLEAAYGDLTRPSYRFAAERLDAGMHRRVMLRLAEEFEVDDQTSIGSDDVCISLLVALRDSPVGMRPWNVQLSLVGAFAVVSKVGDISAKWPVGDDDQDAKRLLALLRAAGLDLLPYSTLAEPTALLPPNVRAGEVYTVYNALFTDSVPYPTDGSNE